MSFHAPLSSLKSHVEIGITSGDEWEDQIQQCVRCATEIVVDGVIEGMVKENDTICVASVGSCIDGGMSRLPKHVQGRIYRAKAVIMAIPECRSHRRVAQRLSIITSHRAGSNGMCNFMHAHIRESVFTCQSRTF
jgi:hypothetical protein